MLRSFEASQPVVQNTRLLGIKDWDWFRVMARTRIRIRIRVRIRTRVRTMVRDMVGQFGVESYR